MKKILVVSFSQSGQLNQIVNNFLTPFNNIDLDRLEIKPITPFPFPWDTTSFYDVMPETVLEEAIAIEPPIFKHENYDLIVFAYQPWYLSPSMPATAMLKNSDFKKRLNNTPVITLIGARNMWLNAQESVRKLIANAGGNLVGNVPLVDKTHNLISVITIVYWLSTGKKDRKWGIFPYPGVAQKEINESYLFGEKAFENLEGNDFKNLQKNILSLNRISINTNILFIESRAKKLFNIWAKTIKNKGTTPKKRALWLKIYRSYLYFALFFVSPIVLTIYTIFFRPLSLQSIKKKKEYFCSIN
jgi:hypothetical protein